MEIHYEYDFTPATIIGGDEKRERAEEGRCRC